MGVEQIEKDKSALAAKLKGVNKRLDHTERAMRREEIPLLEQDYIEQQARDRLAQASAHVDLVASLKAQHEQDLAIKKKLAKLMPDYAAHRDVVAKRRGLDFKAAEEKARKQIEAAKKKRRDEVLAAKQREREQREEEERLEREREARERAEAEEREREEAERKAKQLEIEEEQRQFKEAAEAKAKAAREERMKERAKLDEQAAKQRQRDEEIEARRQARKAEAAAGPARSAHLLSVRSCQPADGGRQTRGSRLGRLATRKRRTCCCDGRADPTFRIREPSSRSCPRRRAIDRASAAVRQQDECKMARA